MATTTVNLSAISARLPRQRRDLVGQVRSAGLRLYAWPHCAASLPSGPRLRHIACNVAARLRLANCRPTLTACSRQRRVRWLTATCGVAATPGGNAATVYPVSSRSRRADFQPAPIAFRPCGHFVLIGTRSLRAAALTALASLRAGSSCDFAGDELRKTEAAMPVGLVQHPRTCTTHGSESWNPVSSWSKHRMKHSPTERATTSTAKSAFRRHQRLSVKHVLPWRSSKWLGASTPTFNQNRNLIK